MNSKNEIFIVFLSAMLSREPINCLLTALIVSKYDIMIEFLVNAILGYFGWVLLNRLIRTIVFVLYKFRVFEMLVKYYTLLKLVLFISLLIARYLFPNVNFLYLGLLAIEIVMFCTA